MTLYRMKDFEWKNKDPNTGLTKSHSSGISELPVCADDVVLHEWENVADDVILAASSHQHQTNAGSFAGVPVVVIVEFFLLWLKKKRKKWIEGNKTKETVGKEKASLNDQNETLAWRLDTDKKR